MINPQLRLPDKLSQLQFCHGLSDTYCEELAGGRSSWRRFVGLGLQDAMRMCCLRREADHLELEFRCVCWNLKRLANLRRARKIQPPASAFGPIIHSLVQF